MLPWTQAHGGLVGTVIFSIAGFNVVMTAIKNVFDGLKIQEPSFLQKIGSVGSAIASWLSANTSQKPPAA